MKSQAIVGGWIQFMKLTIIIRMHKTVTEFLKGQQSFEKWQKGNWNIEHFKIC